MNNSPNIILSTLNARYIHSALGLRYLYANMDRLMPSTQIFEFTIDKQPIEIAEQLLALEPEIIGFGVYIWNTVQTEQVIKIIKTLKPAIVIVLGGPEVSYEQSQQSVVSWCDYVVSGPADLAFAKLCRQILNGDPPKEKFVSDPPPNINELQPPYAFYSDEDIAHRVLYVEASRGCPFKCEFCLSALDKTAWAFDLDRFLQQLSMLYEKGARHFKFVDRTFNLKINSSIKILEFFLQRMDENLFLHFEVIPDHLPERLKAVIQRFPAGSLQFEIGIQSFNSRVQELISRKQDNGKVEENIRWLRDMSKAHLHTDLIVGLPGESWQSFAAGFNRLITLDPHEIQVGILKRLRGSPIIRHTDAFSLQFSPLPPYNVLATKDLDFQAMQRLSRFARYWDMIGNSGYFVNSRRLILDDAPFERFMQLSDWLWNTTAQTHRIALKRLFDLLYNAMTQQLHITETKAREALAQDLGLTGIKGLPNFLATGNRQQRSNSSTAANRQLRHLKSN